MPSVLPLVLLTTSVLGVTQVVRANLLEELDQSQALQSGSAGIPVPSAGGAAPQQAPSELNTGEGLKSSADVPVASGPFQPDNSGRGMGGCNNNGPLLNLAPGSYIQFKVAVPPGFLARMDDTPDGGKVIVVISPEPPCPKCGAQQYSSSGTATNAFEGALPSPLPQGNAGNMKVNVQNYQESAQMVQRTGQAQGPSSGGTPQSNYPQQYAPAPEQTVSSSQMYMKNSAYRKVQVGAANQQNSYQARNAPNFPPQPSPPQPSFQQRSLPPPPPPPMAQRMVRPSNNQYQQQPMPSTQYQQPQYSQVNSAPEYQQQPQQQQQAQSQYIQQTDTNSYQQQSSEFQPPPPSQQQPVAALQKFQTALRSLDDGSDQ